MSYGRMKRGTLQLGLLFALASLFSDSSLRAQTITPPYSTTFADLKGWSSVDIGDAADLGGSDTIVAGNELVVSGSGSQIGGDADGCRYVYQQINGDFIAVAKVTVKPTFQAGAEAGIMVRQSAEAGGIMAFVGVSRDNGTDFVSRSDGTATADAGSKVNFDALWVKLERRGAWVKGSFSIDGITWFSDVGASGAVSSVKVSLKDPVMIGLAMTPANNTAVDIAHFANFSVSAPTAGTGGFAATVTIKGDPTLEDGVTPVTPDGVYVRALDSTGKELGGAFASGGTAAVLSGLPAGAAKLQATGNGYDQYSGDVTIAAGQVTETSIVLNPSNATYPQGAIAGSVTDASAKGQPNVEILAISAINSEQGPYFTSTMTDAKGNFALSVPPGTYNVTRLSDPRYVPVNDDVQAGVVVAANGKATANFTVTTLPIVHLSTENKYIWRAELGPDVTASEDHTALADPETNFVDYNVVEGKSPWGVLDTTSRAYGWVRLKFQLPAEIAAFKGDDLRLYGFTFEDTDICYFNGAKIGGAGFHNADVNNDAGFVSAWEKVRDYTVPNSAVNWSGDNVIAFKGFVRNCTVENGGFSVKSPPLLTVIQTAAPAGTKGDLNGDGKVTINDATLALRMAVGLITPTATQLTLGDLNGDKKITIQDVTKILSAAVGLTTL